MSCTDLIAEIVWRDDAEFTAWALDWLSADLPAAWADLDDETRDGLVGLGIVEEIEADVECVSAEGWREDWRSDENGSWPCYDLRVTADGMDPLDLTGWHYVGPTSGYHASDWAVESDDGCYNGTPTVDAWEVCGGADIGTRHEIPCWRIGDRLVTLDRDALETVVEDAAGEADHGDAPDWESVDRDDMDTEDTVYVVQDGRVVEVDLLLGGEAAYTVTEYAVESERTYDMRHYHAEAWSHSLTDDVFADRDDTIRDLEERASEEMVYDDEAEALAALCRMADDRHDRPDGLTVDCDDDGWYVAPEDDEDERYHLDAEEAATVYHGGWDAILDTLTDSFGRRHVLASLRDRQRRLDEIVAEYDPFVGVADSYAAGNCRAVTERVRQQLTDQLGVTGEIGAVRASVLLGLRDDVYSRRACRMAALRVASHN